MSIWDKATGLVDSVTGVKAAKTSAEASKYAADLQQQQYQQTRQDYSPYRGVAVGQETYGTTDAYQQDLDKYNLKLQEWNDGGQRGKSPNKPKESDYQGVTGYTGGSLNQLADYGRTAIDPNSYIPDSNIPQYQRSTIRLDPNISGNIPQYDVNGQVSDFGTGSRQNQYDGQNFDITKDPSYKFRLDEQNRQINRNAAGMGGVVSGNRLEEIMKRSGQMASQEYGAADARNVRDYQLGAGVNQENYGRDVGEFGLQRGAEDTRFGRDLTGYNANRQNEAQQYGRNTSDYQRSYGQNVDQYGRDLTAYNADTSRENQLYGRGVDAYGRAYGAEGDYLNRLASLSNIGQTATSNTASAGAYAANNAGNAIQAAGNARAAGQMGAANAGLGLVQGLTSLWGDNSGTSVTTDYNASFPDLPSWGVK